MMSQICPLYKIPTRNTIKKYIDDKFDYLSMRFKDKLENAENISVTTDAWTMKSFLGITIHFLNGSTFFSGTLGVVEMSQSHTADYIGSQLLNTLTEWNIQKKKIAAVIYRSIDIGNAMYRYWECNVSILRYIDGQRFFCHPY